MRILLLPFEVESFAMGTLAKKLENEGHEVCIANCDLWHFVTGGDSVSNWYNSIGFNNTVNLSSEYEKLHNSKCEVDWDYLKRFERKCCASKNLQQLILTHEMFGRNFRYPRYNLESFDQIYYWTELMLKWCEKVMDEFKPELIFTMERNYFIKNAFWQIAESTGIKMLTLVTGRIKSFFYLSEHFGYGSSLILRKSIGEIGDDQVAEAKDYVDEFNRSRANPYPWAGTLNMDKSKNFGVRRVFGDLYRVLLTFSRRAIRGQDRKFRGFLKPNYVYGIKRKLILYYCRHAINKLRFNFNLSFNFASTLPDRPFIYFTLHMLPEDSVLTLSTEYYEDDLIRFISKEMPIDFLLVVKEHPFMIGDRPFSFYQELAKLPNVVVIDPLCSSAELIERSRGVIGISGTALFEAAMHQKPTLAFGKPDFIDVVDFVGHADIAQFMERCESGSSSLKFQTTLKFVQYIMNEGKELPWKELLYNRDDREVFDNAVDQIYNLLGPHLHKAAIANLENTSG